MSNTYEQMQAIYAAVKARGYTEGYTTDQLLARQVVKLCEELCELAEHVVLDPGRKHSLDNLLADIRERARDRFDQTRAADWIGTGRVAPPAEIIKELTDLMVLISMITVILAGITGEPIDLMQRAVEKAGADVARGVRRHAAAE